MKVLVLLDYVKKEYVKVHGSQVEYKFASTAEGKLLQQILTGKKSGIGLDSSMVDIKFFYPKVPSYNVYSKSYNAIPKKELKECTEAITSYIVKEKPTIILSFGKQVWKALVDKSSNLDYNIQEETFKHNGATHTTTLIEYPNLSLYRFMSRRDKDTILINNRLVKRYVSGDTQLQPVVGTYKLITNFEEVLTIFNDIIPKYKTIAVDFETNTLKTWLKGAKALCISLSWKEHQGVTIPIDHPKCKPFTDSQVSQLIGLINKLMMSSQRKVLHNAKYDVRMLMDIYALPYVQNVIDTMLMYYVGYDENPSSPKNLKHLANVYTDMNNYEEERDTFFNNYLEQHKEAWIRQEQQRLEEEAKLTGKAPKKVKVSQYEPPKNELDGSSVDFSWLPLDTIYKYASMDTDVTLQLYHVFSKVIDKNNQWRNLIYQYYPALVDSLCYMEHTGMYLDKITGAEYKVAYSDIQKSIVSKIRAAVPEIEEFENNRLKALEQRSNLLKSVKPADRTEEQKDFIKSVGKYMGTDSKGNPKYKFNLSSKQHLQILFLDMLGYELPPTKEFLTPKAVKQHKVTNPEKIEITDYKMDKSVLEYFVKTYDSELARLLLEYAKVAKARDAFVDVLPKQADDKGLIHPIFNITGTRTGRLSSSNPNCQQIPKPSHDFDSPLYNYPIKGLYRSRFKDGIIANFDYKSLEIFIAALIGKDGGLTISLMNGEDVHKRNASIAFGVPINQVTGVQRQRAKGCTFGTLYGQTSIAFAEMWNETPEEAQKTIDKVLNAMPGVKKSIDLIHGFCEHYGYVQTLAGNWRRLPDTMQKKDIQAYQRSQRQSYNAVVQGSGPLFTNSSIIIIRNWLQREHLNSRIIATVHDSILFDIHPDEVDKVVPFVIHTMENLPLDCLKCTYESFGINKEDVPDKYIIDDTYFRFPMFSECEIGKTYAQELPYDKDYIHSFGTLHNYCDIYSKLQEIDDYYSSLLMKTNDSDEKEDILKQKEDAKAKWELWKNSQIIK